MLDVGLLHQLEKLARVSRQALDIAPLALGIDGVEREARFAAARQAGDDDQRVARQVDVDALEVMLARTANRNMGETHGRGLFQICSRGARARSEEHTSDLQSLMRISYAVFCLKKK